MATTSSHLSLPSPVGGNGGVSKICLFCLSPADYIPEKGGNNQNGSDDDRTKFYFRQFIWKYLIGDDMVKIDEFTGNQLKSVVPPLCVQCHDKCLQLASYHVKFESIQEKIMQVTKDLLEGWRGKDGLFSKGDYEKAVQHCQKELKRQERSAKLPTNKFIKSPTGLGGGGATGGGAYPSLETIQMYQILRNPEHVRIPLSCLKSFGFTELKMLSSKNSPTSLAKQNLSGPKIPSRSLIQAKQAAAGAATTALLNSNTNISISKVSSLQQSRGTPSALPILLAKKYWINDVQVEMLGNSSGNLNDEEDDYSEEDHHPHIQHRYSAPHTQRKINSLPPPPQRQSMSSMKQDQNIRKPPPMKMGIIQQQKNINSKNFPLLQKFTAPPVPALKQMPNLSQAKRPKLEVNEEEEENTVKPMVEYCDDLEDGGYGEEAEDNNCGNFLETVGNNSKKYSGGDEDEEVHTTSPKKTQSCNDDENGEEVDSDGGGAYEDDGGSFYNGSRSSVEMEDFVGDGGDSTGVNGKKKKKAEGVLRKGTWTQEEDEMISKIVTQTGPRNWSWVALQLGTGRIGKQIRERWTHHLNPEVNKNRWSDQEVLILKKAHARWGNQWSRISKLLPGRTDNAVKNRWNGAKKRKAQLHQASGN